MKTLLHRHRRVLVPATLAVLVAAAALIFHRPLVAWFTIGDAAPTAAGEPRHGAHGGAPPTPAPDEPAEPALAPIALPPPALDAVRAALAAYEGGRALLAADELGGLDGHARALGEALGDAAVALPERPDLRAALAEGAAAADRLAAAVSLEEARLGFGEVGRVLVALAMADPRLQEGRHLFSCPMSEGYRKWLQSSPRLENPYMGPSMLACGSTALWDPPPVEDAISHEGHGHEGHETAFHTCPMHPSVRQQDFGACPICGMDLTPVTWDEFEGGVIVMDDSRRQRIGVRTSRVGHGPMPIRVRAVGHLAYDETKLADVSLKLPGWIVRLHVNQPGQQVKKGQTLFTLYSPELRAAQDEYLLALRSQARAAETGAPDRADYLVAAARKRLALWDVSPAQLRRIEAAGAPLEEIPFASPVSGHVIEKDVVEGAAIAPGQRLYRIADLDTLWVEADVYESDLPHVRVGQAATITLPYQPGRAHAGEVSFVYPYLDRATRTARVRIELSNPGLALRPNMYANVELEADLGERLRVPASAVIFTGPRRLVFVDLGEGRLRPQEVTLGARAGEYYEIVDGLREGQLVVTSGNFLVAAESRIRSAADHWTGDSEDGHGAH